MSDWSELPKELLGQIAERLDSPFYHLRFRSVCSWWRSSASQLRLRLPDCLPILKCDESSDSYFGFHLSQRTIFLIGSSFPHSQTPPWLVKVEEVHPSRMRLLNPLSWVQLKPPTSFPAIDLTHFKVLELGQEYTLHAKCSVGDLEERHKEKVMLRSSGCGDEFSVLTIFSGRLAIFNSWDEKWIIIPHALRYDDLILFRGDFYAVDHTGRVVLVDLSLDVSLVAESICDCGIQKFLVESDGGLLLVDVYLSFGDVNDCDIDEVFDIFWMERNFQFKVFELDIKGKRWVEVESLRLRDRLIFLGESCSFSASVGEFIKGNCILFTDKFFGARGKENSGGGSGTDTFVFDLDTYGIALLTDCPEYSRLFWPPPDWVLTTHLTVQNRFDELSL